MTGQGGSVERMGPLPLAGASVVVTRNPERSGSLVSAIEAAGAEAVLLPLIDFERAADQHSLDVACDALAAGAFDWLVISSATTVHVLKAKAAERGRTLAGWLPESTRVAAVGAACCDLLETEGVSVALAPAQSQSAAGLLAAWPADAGRVLLPQADIAAPRLGEGLAAAGAEVTVVTAYRTVDYPAEPERRLAIEPAEPPSYAILSAEGAREGIAAGRLHAIVAASPSAVRRIEAILSPLGGCRLVAIGRSTADQAAALGLQVGAVAAEPTPEGLVRALAEALNAPGKPQAPRLAHHHDSPTPDTVKDRS